MSATIQDAIVLFGDSITQGAWAPGMNGYGQQLADVYARRLDVLNRGFSGYNTDWAMPIFKKIIARKDEREFVPKIRLLTIFFGANDACLAPNPQHCPVKRFVANLEEWIDMVSSPKSEYYSPETRIILITTPPINTKQRLANGDSDRNFETAKMYADAVRDLAHKKKVPVTDIWTILWEAAGKNEQSLSRFMYDGLHLNKEGYEVLFNALIATIKENYPELHFSALPEAFPPWLVMAKQSQSQSN